MIKKTHFKSKAAIIILNIVIKMLIGLYKLKKLTELKLLEAQLSKKKSALKSTDFL
ncbi:hypothetical protein [Polaribacter cellanae]|uniref:Uncharacterized protein n=1 Tax=Polaribacter cellanae TaxID=2818493 RepID=A0A975H8K8_9FLAO|nr:hypothetical protein [Polaribacter cellanae]QTE24164.1 hypothetical protein J3359_07845 [Polaribacter cellanae]